MGEGLVRMDSVGWCLKDLPTEERRRDWVGFASEQAPWLTYTVFYAIFANLPYWIVEHEFGLNPRLGWFCVQYVTVGLIALVVPRIPATISLFAVMIADLLCGICLTFNLPPRACLANLTQAHAFTRFRLFCAIAVGLLALLEATVAVMLPGKTLPKKQRWHVAASLVAFVAIIVGVDALSIRRVTGQLPTLSLSPHPHDRIDSDISVPRLARVPIIRLIRIEANQTGMNAFEKSGPASAFPVRSATDFAVTGAGIVPRGNNADLPNVVLVLVESLGLASDATLNAAMIEPFSQPQIKAKYEVFQGSVPFLGPTVSGEARELCGSGIGFHVLTAPAADLRSCLPTRLSALGYGTIGVHGMSGHMFNRSVWYRTIGFQERWFYEQFKQQGLPDCAGAFIGTCDSDIASWIGRRLTEGASRPIFIHWVTLDSHLPVPVPTHLPTGAQCSAELLLKPDSPLCAWYQLIVNAHRSVAQLALDPVGRPTVFVIVGDHAPPFADTAAHDRFSQDDVPYVVLLPRAQHDESKSMIAHNALTPSNGATKPVRELR